MAQGNHGFVKVFFLYVLAGVVSTFLRMLLGPSQRHKHEHEFVMHLVPFLLFFACATIVLPHYPWRRLTATLPFDVMSAMFSVMVSRTLTNESLCRSDGWNPLGNLNYNPSNDPYYVSNLDTPVQDFFVSALADVKFTNIVHIVLESMRDDSYPFQEDGLLNKHIKKNMRPVKGGAPVNTQTITPFIASLAEHTISWHTMWATIPYTHKSMLACTSFHALLIQIGVE